MTNKEWFARLKAGDTVLVRSNGGDSVAKVESVTPSGRVRVGSREFAPPLGWERGGRGQKAIVKPPPPDAEELVEAVAAVWAAIKLLPVRDWYDRGLVPDGWTTDWTRLELAAGAIRHAAELIKKEEP